MFCSNCRVTNEICGNCEQGHYFCELCTPQVNEKCILCSGQIIHRKTLTQLLELETNNWAAEMMLSMQDEFLENAEECLISNAWPLKANSHEATPTNLLYSRGQPFLGDSDSDNLSVLSPSVNNPNVSDYDTNPMRFAKRGSPVIDRKDTRQQILDHTKEEIRNKIVEEIFNLFEKNPRSCTNPEEFTCTKQFQTVGVSTESTPALIPQEVIISATPKESIVNVTEITENSLTDDHREFIVMNLETSDMSKPQLAQNFKNKNALSPMDFRLQQVMGAILESVTKKPTSTNEDQTLCKLFCEKFPRMPLTKLKEVISAIYDEGDNLNLVPPCQKELLQTPSIDSAPMAHSRRAFYNPPNTFQSETTPNSQSQPISFYHRARSSDQQSMEPIDAATLNIPRSPIICPISTCQRAFFVSDFTKHIAVDHNKVPRERICPHQCKNFFLDPKLMHFGVSRCQVLLLVRDKIKNLGHERFKDFIPILVMTSKVSLLELCCNQYRPHSKEVKNSQQNFFMIWLTGLIPPQLPIYFSLTVWARSGCIPICHIVHSGQLYSVRDSQSPDAVQRSGQMMLLSENQIDLLTNNGRHMLEFQVAVH